MAHHDLLIGRWTGEGMGEYPTIEAFTYRETLVVEAVPGRPAATWRSTTVDGDSGEARHSEVGFLRSNADGCELVLAHSFAITEIAIANPPDQGMFRFASVAMAGSPTAKDVASVARTFMVDDDVLSYDTAMAAVGQHLTHHLRAQLRRT